MDGNSEVKTLVMIVDDVEINTSLLAQMIESMGCRAEMAQSVREAFLKIGKELPQLILSDIMMPETNGYQFCDMLKKNPVTRNIPVIFISAADEINDKQRAFECGAVDFISKPYEFTEVTMRVNNQLKIYHMQKELEYNNRMLNMVVNEQNQKIEQERKNILRALAMLVESHNSNGSYLENVSYNSRILAQGLNFSDKYENKISSAFIESIGISSMIHDIGKIAVTRDILMKPEALTAGEKEEVRLHTVRGAQLLMQVYPNYNDNEFVQMSIDIVKYHHERWDGSGYPEGLKGEEIPLAARIVAITDMFDKLIGVRTYQESVSAEAAAVYINKHAGTKYDAYIVDVFNKLVKRMKIN